jgi:hypothetical protein
MSFISLGVIDGNARKAGRAKSKEKAVCSKQQPFEESPLINPSIRILHVIE